MIWSNSHAREFSPIWTTPVKPSAQWPMTCSLILSTRHWKRTNITRVGQWVSSLFVVVHEHLRTFQLAPGDKIWKNVTNNKLFLVRHYAGKDRVLSTREKSIQNALHELNDFLFVGDVVYSVDGFLDKNRDTLFDDFKRLLYHSKNPILSSMWPEGEKSITSVTRRPLTAGTLFRNSMISLSNLLSSKVRSDRSFNAVP